jgi:hypothetical protein
MVKLVDYHDITGSAFRESRGLRDLSADQVAKEFADVPETGALLIESENTYLLRGELNEMVPRYYRIGNPAAAHHLLVEMVKLAVKSGTPERTAFEWGLYNAQRWMSK